MAGCVAAGQKPNRFQLWQPESHPIEFSTAVVPQQKLNHIRYNPV